MITMKALTFTFLVALVALSACNSKSIQEPEYRDIRSVRVKNVGLLETSATVDLVYFNPNNFGVQLTSGRGDVYVDNVYLGRFDLEDAIDVRKNSEFIIPATFKLDMIGAVKNQRDIYKKKEALIRIDGSARVKKAGISMNVPIKYEGMQNLEKFRTLVRR